jgi:signal transduction histidine kinase
MNAPCFRWNLANKKKNITDIEALKKTEPDEQIKVSEYNRIKRELREAKMAAESAINAKGEFLNAMRHEMFTPLNIIMGFTQILERDGMLTDKQREFVHIVLHNSRLLHQVIHNILELYEAKLNYSDFQFCLFLEDVIDFSEHQSRLKKIGFVFQNSKDLPASIYGDQNRLKQILQNLLINAFRYTKEGKVTFEVEHYPGKLCFRVKDTGIGIPSDKLEEIFLPFRQVADKSLYVEGAGLGLATSRRLVRMMGSELYVESTLGEGSAFWFELSLF